MDWYKIAQDGIYDITFQVDEMLEQQRERDADQFVNNLMDGPVADFQAEMRRDYLTGKSGMLGKEHFIPRPARTEVSINPKITPDEIIEECINKYGDFTIRLKWEGDMPWEEISASEFIARRRTGEFDAATWTDEQMAISDEWIELMSLPEPEKNLPENQKKLQEIDKQMETFAWKPYVRMAEVSATWVPPVDINSLSDYREGEYLAEVQKRKGRGEVAW